jgi:nicotinate-nucleotide pyrophosphorylase (carboxylating)
MQTPLITQYFSQHPAAFNDLVTNMVQRALQEDVGDGDRTALLIPVEKQAQATIIARESAVICGVDWVNACFKQTDANIHIAWMVKEGDTVAPNQTLCQISGQARALLTAERNALNFLQTLSATATETNQYVKAIAGLPTQILDTRKTIPGFRLAQKYAVTVGGGANQRLALYDGVLIKENHIATAGGIEAVLEAAFKIADTSKVQIEVETIEQMLAALAAGAKNILLDNFTISQLQEAVALNQKRALLEASGNVNLTTIKAIAETGVDRISIGALTKHVKAIDLSMRVKMQ